MNDLLLSILIGAVVIMVGMLVWVAWKLEDLLGYCRANATDAAAIRQQVFTTQGRIKPQSGPRTLEQDMQRAGKASVGKRVVVGGDPDSTLNSNLRTQVEEDDDA